MASDLIIGMAGSGGDGVISAGESLITALAIDGYHAMMTKSYGPQIRGGESSFRIRLSTKPVLNRGGGLDIAIALNWEDFLKFGSELQVADNCVIIYDSASDIKPENIPLKGINPSQVISAPIGKISNDISGTSREKNIVVLGLIAGWFGIGRESILAGIRKRFSKKSNEILSNNEKAFVEGMKFAKENPLKDKSKEIETFQNKNSKMITDGNEICAAASIFAGCQFFGGYPITPSSEIMHFHSREIWRYGGTMIQCEDEIASIGSAIGASFAGKKAMTATSGPGMALKSEFMGLATMTELPLVIVNVQRVGPSTGIPTKSEQSDLFQAAFSAAGDSVRPILAPLNVEDMFGVTVEAFNIAEKYQTPVIILSDQELSQRKETFNPIDTSKFIIENRKLPTTDDLVDYKRYKMTDDFISPISYPGLEGGNYLASGLEHNELGSPASKGEIHTKLNEKRTLKLNPLKDRKDLFLIRGDIDAKIGIISWGTVAGVAIEAQEILEKHNIKTKLIIPKLIYPISEKIFSEFFEGIEQGLVIEQNYLGQFYHILRMYVDIPKGIKQLCKSGSNPIVTGEIVDLIQNMNDNKG
ncbi:MAG: 2-oxoacid:acceptor oxidoreductase subunit alpha [Leptospiraceae bacterium]|nr:2-oxoacid:acceptor oxidoreductase subunit alpha [Leptospiraceae bacterium]